LEDSPSSNIFPILKEDENGNKIEDRNDGDEKGKEDQQRMVVDGMSNGNIKEGELKRILHKY
jgi:hypothetical protein